ncbi:MAG TPA: glycine cleavage system protein GcvH [Actinomycetota bacterium]
MDYPSELRYTKEHEWAAPDEGTGRVRVGITDFAQDALGDVVYVDLPQEGTEVRAGEPFGEVESTKSVSDIYSPVTGKVVARNGGLEDAPELVNQDPYGEGWMVVIEMADPSQLTGLLSASEYQALAEKGQEEEEG